MAIKSAKGDFIMIKCTNCGTEINDDNKFCTNCGADLTEQKPTIKFCPYCGHNQFLQNDSGVVCEGCGNIIDCSDNTIHAKTNSDTLQKTENSNISIPKTNKRKLITIISIVIFMVIVISIVIGVICNHIPDKKYEAKAAQCINSVQQVLKNPDSLQVREMSFYDNNLKDDVASNDLTDGLIKLIGDGDVCVMKYSAQNGFGGNGFNYAFLIYSAEDDKYYILGTTDTLDEEEVDEDDEDACLIINFVVDNLKPACTFDMDKSMTILKKYS